MSRVVQSAAAGRDLRGIWRYIASDDPGRADALIDLIKDKLAVLADSPGIGSPRPELGDEVRSFTIGNYRLFHRPLPEDIRLLRVMHSARDVADLRLN